MKVFLILWVLILSSLVVFVRPMYAQNSLLVPVPADNTHTPSLSVLSPLKDSVVSSKFTLEMAVSNFQLTTKPTDSPDAGVVAVYVDGKFFTNTASTSAQLSIPRTGTHHVEVELTRSDRFALVPRVVESFFIHVQKKTPYLWVPQLRPDTVIYSATPTFQIMYEPASFEDKAGYYQVFVDGAVDGDSRTLEDGTRYTLTNPLEEGKHSLRVAWYTENGRPFVPAVEYQIPFVYSRKTPAISNVALSRNALVNEAVPFALTLSDFEPGKDGYIDVFAEGIHYFLTSASGSLPNLSVGNQKIRFTLVTRDGFPLIPGVSVEKVVTVGGGQQNTGSLSNLFPTGTFLMVEDGQNPRWGFIVLGAFEALAIIIFGALLMHHERKREK